jgi:nicotinic acid phosphoribosyltransferase
VGSRRRIRFSSGWGTYLTNDFRNCNPLGGEAFDPVSLVCKLTEVEGRPAVKLSDNYAKAMGPAATSASAFSISSLGINVLAFSMSAPS